MEKSTQRTVLQNLHDMERITRALLTQTKKHRARLSEADPHNVPLDDVELIKQAHERLEKALEAFLIFGFFMRSIHADTKRNYTKKTSI